MTPAETARLLAACASFDQRTVGEFDVIAWHKAIGHLDYNDSVEAVARYYAANRTRIMPSDVAEGVRAIRNERAERKQHEIRALPSRFEDDQIRDHRVATGVRRIAEYWSMPKTDEPSTPHDIALERARRERGKRPLPTAQSVPKRGTKTDLSKVDGPDWATPEARERTAVAALHASGRRCGRPACPRCNADEEPS